jgi:hypothetical protein
MNAGQAVLAKNGKFKTSEVDGFSPLSGTRNVLAKVERKSSTV